MNGYNRNRSIDNLDIVAARLWRLQDNLNNLENKLNRSMSGLQSLLEEGEEKKSETVDETQFETPNNPLETEIKDEEEENIPHRTSAGTNKASEECDRIKKTVNIDDLNNLDFPGKNLSWKTCDYWSLPKWLQTNSYILKGHRPPLPSFQECFLSIFRIHTETVNIWTHLLGCLLFVALFLHTALGSLPLQDKLVLSPFFLGAILCLGLSSAFHTLLCHSENVMWVSSRLDFVGIILLIDGSFIPWLYYAFCCDNTLRILYMVGIVSLGACVAAFSLSETFAEPLYKSLRASVFVAFGLSGVIPGIHFMLIDGWEAFVVMGFPLVIMALFYIAGAFIYASNIPERIFPGKCDILFQSHQVFHVLVVLATVIDYFGILRLSTFIQFGRENPDFCLRKQYYFGIRP